MRVEKRTRRKVVHECNYFFDSDGIKTEIWGYHRSRFYTFLTYMGYLLTGGILRLVFHWLPHWQLYATHRRCPLPVGNQVLIMDQYKRYSVHNVLIFTRDGTRVKVVTFCKFSNEVHGSTSSVAHISTSSKHGSYNAVQDQITRNGYTVAPLDAPASTPLLIPDIQDTSLTYHFMYKKMKYIWDTEKRCFRLSPGWENARCSQFYEALPLDSVTAYRRQIEFGENNIIIPITPLMEMLVKEGLNPFYVFQIASCTLWYIDQYWMFATCIVVISATTLLWQLYELRKNEQALRDTVCSSGTAFVCRNSSGKNVNDVFHILSYLS
jgi:cation-transporting P-type ATPase 13A2